VKNTQRRMARPSLGGMLATRQGALVLALVCAACAAGIVLFALGQYKTAQTTPQTVQATVLVATAEITKGTSGDVVASRGLYKSTPIVASQVTPGALSDASLLAGKVASANVLPGQQLTAADFTGVTSVSGLLTPSQRAITLTISESPGATDVLQAGDHVDVYAEIDGNVVLMAQNIQVIKPSGATVTAAAGQTSSAAATPAGTSTASASSTTSATSASSGAAATAPAAGGFAVAGASMVLAVSDKQASDFVATQLKGETLYLTVRPPNASGQARIFTSTAEILRDAVAYSNSNLNGGH
jgi:Flp pilus assembly protein CpaB